MAVGTAVDKLQDTAEDIAEDIAEDTAEDRIEAFVGEDNLEEVADTAGSTVVVHLLERKVLSKCVLLSQY
jgi:hypothetical protein